MIYPHKVHPAGGDVCRTIVRGLGAQDGQPGHLLRAGELSKTGVIVEVTKMIFVFGGGLFYLYA